MKATRKPVAGGRTRGATKPSGAKKPVAKPAAKKSAVKGPAKAAKAPAKKAVAGKASRRAPAKASPRKAASKTTTASRVSAKPAAKSPAKPAAKSPAKPAAKAVAPAAKSTAKVGRGPTSTSSAKQVVASAVKAPAGPKKRTENVAAAPAPAPAAPKVEAPKPQPLKPQPPKPEPPKKPRKPELTPREIAAIRVQLEEQKTTFLREFAEIEEGAFNSTQSEMSGESSFDEEYADAGSFTFEREKELSIGNNIRDLLDKVQHALAAIDRGTYGICENCGDPISKARLLALPYSTLCLKCKQQEERTR